jgi:hypothetical protein
MGTLDPLAFAGVVGAAVGVAGTVACCAYCACRRRRNRRAQRHRDTPPTPPEDPDDARRQPPAQIEVAVGRRSSRQGSRRPSSARRSTSAPPVLVRPVYGGPDQESGHLAAPPSPAVDEEEFIELDLEGGGGGVWSHRASMEAAVPCT